MRNHKKISKEILYTYTKLYNRTLNKKRDLDRFYNCPETKTLSPQERYALKTEIIKDLIETSEDRLKEYETGLGESSFDEQRDYTNLKQTITGAKEILKNLQYHYKQKYITPLKTAPSASQGQSEQ